MRKFFMVANSLLRKLGGEKNIGLDYSLADVENRLEIRPSKGFQRTGKNVSNDTDGRQFRPVLIQ
jgi:hypothetical protein